MQGDGPYVRTVPLQPAPSSPCIILIDKAVDKMRRGCENIFKDMGDRIMGDRTMGQKTMGQKTMGQKMG